MIKSIGHILNKSFKKSHAFTIVELLVVIVVIGILAAITIVSYSGITNKAISASIKNDLDNNLKLLKMYQIDHGYYPTSLDSNYCPTAPDVDARYCLRAMNGATLVYVGGEQSFELIDTHAASTIAYKITEDGSMVVYAPGPWKQVSVGDGHACGVSKYNQAYCWGANSYGQLGNNTTVGSDTNPVMVQLGDRSNLNVKTVVAGGSFSCLISMEDKLYCWGYNGFGNIGDGTTANKSTPVAVLQGDMPSLSVKAVELSRESQTACAIANNDRAYCWGLNNYGQLGDNTTVAKHAPTAVVQGVRSSLAVSKISVGSIHSCLVDLSGLAYCWGYNGQGGVGNNDTVDVYQPTAVLKGSRPSTFTKSLSAGKHNNCVIASDDQVYCWGYNPFGALGNGTATSSYVPVSIVQGVMSSYKMKEINISGASHSCALNFDDKVYCWGRNDYYQLGHGLNDSFIYTPVAVVIGARPSLTTKTISVGTNLSCLINTDDKVYCWGSLGGTPVEIPANF